MRILITEANYKNSIALQRELHRENRHQVFAMDKESVFFAKRLGYCKDYIVGDLEESVKQINPEFIIPVGSEAVKICSEKYRELCLIPTKESLEIALNKDKMLILNSLSDVNYPECKLFSNLEELRLYSRDKNCVVKSSNESLAKFDPLYVKLGSESEFEKIEKYLSRGVKLLMQEQVSGVGRGFFCIAKEGKIISYYMHQRIREIPITGGSSTAAKSIFCEKMFNISKQIIEYLNWSGPLMIEYKYDETKQQYYLIELNPKFWGSLDLSYAVGLNFGKTLIEAYSNNVEEQTEKKYEVEKKFFWVLDGDLLVLLKTGKLHKIKEYFYKDSYTNLFENFFVDSIKLIWTIKKIFSK
ncbi:ATP-grasp domain-containing protein [Chryseobacterium sp. R2ACT005]|uniref:ATP-grasp domain-containing protein n=1 Tax=Chryseobacterium sp. R2ACT005 TaxID=3416668 RepID=UPI003CEEEB9A